METNSTSEGIQQSFHVTQCPDLEEISKRSLVFVASLVLLSVVNGVLLFVAVLGNAVILWVLRGVSSIHPPSRTLFYSLAASDVCVGLIVQPFNLIYMISTAKGKAALCSSALPYWDVIGFAMSGISLLTTCEISVDRLLALRLKLRYREVVSLGRTALGCRNDMATKFCGWISKPMEPRNVHYPTNNWSVSQHCCFIIQLHDNPPSSSPARETTARKTNRLGSTESECYRSEHVSVQHSAI